MEKTNRMLHPQEALASEEHGPATFAGTHAEYAWFTGLSFWLIPLVAGRLAC